MTLWLPGFVEATKCIYAICRTIGCGKISRILFNFDNHSKSFFSSIILEVFFPLLSLFSLTSDANGQIFCGHGQIGICPFDNLQVRAKWAFGELIIFGHGQGFSQMPYGMPYIFWNFDDMGKWAIAYLVTLRAQWALDFWQMDRQ